MSYAGPLVLRRFDDEWARQVYEAYAPYVRLERRVRRTVKARQRSRRNVPRRRRHGRPRGR